MAVFAQPSDEYVNLNGEIEVSDYIFYLVTEDQRYELISDTQLPIVKSGTMANVKGRLYEDAIIVESFTPKPATTALTEQEQNLIAEAAKEEQVPSEGTKPFGIKWPYIAALLILIAAFLSYLEITRINNHRKLMRQQTQHMKIALRNYVITNLRKGFTKEQIKNALVKNNYSKNEVEEAFKVVIS